MYILCVFHSICSTKHPSTIFSEWISNWKAAWKARYTSVVKATLQVLGGRCSQSLLLTLMEVGFWMSKDFGLEEKQRKKCHVTMVMMIMMYETLGGGFKHFLFSSLPREDSYFD